MLSDLAQTTLCSVVREQARTSGARAATHEIFLERFASS
jgi:hypothetical protein